METTIFEILHNDGRLFRVLCNNRNQRTKLLRYINSLGDKIKKIDVLTTGITTTKQYFNNNF